MTTRRVPDDRRTTIPPVVQRMIARTRAHEIARYPARSLADARDVSRALITPLFRVPSAVLSLERTQRTRDSRTTSPQNRAL